MHKHSHSPEELERRINACWLGKAIGGTLGGPHEGKPGPLALKFYDPPVTTLLPNDDLDLQIVWLHHLLQTGATEVTPAVLLEAWQEYVKFPFDEYAICLRNGAYGLKDERLGAFDNWFSECMGAAIRSEMWACIAPGDPDRAAALAWNDAVCDHAGDGVWAEVFFAAVEAAAFSESSFDQLLDTAAAFLPTDCRVARAVATVRRRAAEVEDWKIVREEIHQEFGHDNFTDVAANVAYTVLGLLMGRNDFGESILIATNCGADTDCTAATLGALLGIIDPDSIPSKWKDPVGDAVVLSPQIVGVPVPARIHDLTQWTLRVREQLAGFEPTFGEVLPREPATEETTCLSIPAAINGQARELHGHWLSWKAEGFRGPQKIELELSLQPGQRVNICAWSPAGVEVRLNGERLDNVAADAICSHCRDGAPSFHRGGPGIFAQGRDLEAGVQNLEIIWNAPEAGEEADLVFGVADAKNNLWLPFALGEQVTDSALV